MGEVYHEWPQIEVPQAMDRSRSFEPTPEQRAMIEAKIDVSIGGLTSEEARRACTAARALPLYLDWSACMAIRPDGEIIWIDYAEPHRVRLVEDERERNIGLFQGSLRDPDLGFLVRLRPAEAVDCPDCRGTGRIPFPEGSEHLADRVVCYCGGIGWLPDEGGHRNDRQERGRRPILRFVLMVIAVPPSLLTLSLFGLFPWSGLNSWRYDIDINSGRIRYTRHLLWMEVTSFVRDSVLTKALSPEDLSGRTADWMPVTTLSPGQHHSPHHRFHGAIFQIRELESCWETGKMTPAARRVMARQVLHLWREWGNYHPAGDYIEATWEKAGEAEKQGKAMGVNDLPVPR